MIQQGSVINDTYRIDAKIGAGGGGTVYKAYHLRLQKYVVVKRINDAWVDVMDSRKEADIIKNLKHQYLPQAYDFLHLTDGIYTVMDFVPGESLDKYIKSGYQFRQEQILYWTKQVTEALVYLHSLTPPIIHSDIKPANIMINLEGNVCLIDFNVSMTGTPDSSISATSRGYAAPEQYLNIQPVNQPQPGVPYVPKYQFDMDSPLDARSDIYSLGATLYHLMTGQRPPKLPEQRLPEIPLDLPGYDEALIKIVNKMTAYDPRSRYQSAEELLYDLEHINELDARHVHKKRRKLILAVVLAALVVAAAVTGLFVYLNMQKQSEQAFEDKLVYAANLTDKGEYEAAQKAYEEAMQMNGDRIGSYTGMLKLYSDQGNYDKAIEYAKDTLAEHHFDNDAAKDRADFYYILANAYFEQEDYEKAVENYGEATGLYQENAEYYRDFAIALARSGYVDKAKEMLQKAEQLQLAAPELELVKAEIAFAEGDFGAASAGFEKVLKDSADSAVRQRAVMYLCRAYREQGEYEKVQSVIAANKPQLDSAHLRNVQLLSAETYLRMADEAADRTQKQEYAKKALEQYQAAGGVQTKKTQFNLVTAYQYLDDMENAQQILNKMMAEYSEDPEVFARLAILEVYKQEKTIKENRSYERFRQYYERAEKLDQKNKINGTSSPAIKLMEDYMKDLTEKKWL